MSDIDREQWLNDMAYSAWLLGSTGDGVGCLNAGIRAVYQRGHEDGAAELTRLRSQLAAEVERTAIQRGCAEKWKELFDERNRLWQEAEKRLEAIGVLLGDNGCDCECDHSAEEHDDDCERCLACRIGGVLEHRARYGGGK